MRIGDAAARAGTTPRALRFYEERGLLPPPARTPTGQRVYTRRHIELVGVIRELLASGLTVADVHRCADQLDGLIGRLPRACARPAPGERGEPGGSEGPEAEEGVAARRLAVLDAEIARLTRLRERLAHRMAPVTAPGMET